MRVRDVAPVVTLTRRVYPNTESKCELPGVTERAGSTVEGDGRGHGGRRWQPSRLLERGTRKDKGSSLAEREQSRGERVCAIDRERGSEGEREKDISPD